MTAAALDLPVNKNLGFAWIVPYGGRDGKVAQFQMGWKGFVQLALRTSLYQRMNAKPINAEAFGGYDDVGEPKIIWENIDETKEAIGYVFAWKLTNGFTKVCYWPKSKVEGHAKRYSKAYQKGYDSPWKTHFDEMALKTVVKNELSRWGILSIQLERALKSDQATIKEDGEPDFIDAETETIKPDFGAPNELNDAPAETPKEKPTKAETKVNYARALVRLCGLDGIKESTLVSALCDAGKIDETLTTLTDIEKVNESALKWAHDNWSSGDNISARIKAVKVQ